MPLKTMKRVLLKLSGEVLMGDQQFGIDPAFVLELAKEVKTARETGLEICLVIGGGNIFRGMAGAAQGMDRAQADYMGMLATVMNGLAMRDALERRNIKTRLMSALPIGEVTESYSSRNAIRYLKNGEVCIFVAGTGNPFFTTDTAACLRGIEIEAGLILKATKVDGVYDKDPSLHSDATKYDGLTFDEVLEQKLGVMDLTAIALCREHNVPLQVFDMTKPNALLNVVMGENEGTRVYH